MDENKVLFPLSYYCPLKGLQHIISFTYKYSDPLSGLSPSPSLSHTRICTQAKKQILQIDDNSQMWKALIKEPPAGYWEWWRRWRYRLLRRLQRRGHCGQAKGFSPVWVMTWRSYRCFLPGPQKLLWQYGQSITCNDNTAQTTTMSILTLNIKEHPAFIITISPPAS